MRPLLVMFPVTTPPPTRSPRLVSVPEILSVEPETILAFASRVTFVRVFVVPAIVLTRQLTLVPSSPLEIEAPSSSTRPFAVESIVPTIP